MLEDHRTAIVVALVVIVGLEVWRRSVRHRAPTWVHLVTIVLLAIVGGGVAYTQWQLTHVMEAVGASAGGEKATHLSRGSSGALNGDVVAVISVMIAVVVLGIGTYLARRLPDPDDAPVAQTR